MARARDRQEPCFVDLWIEEMMTLPLAVLEWDHKVVAWAKAQGATYKDGRDSYESVPTMAGRIGVSPATVKRAMPILEALGIIRRSFTQAGRKGTATGTARHDLILPSDLGLVPRLGQYVYPTEPRQSGQHVDPTDRRQSGHHADLTDRAPVGSGNAVSRVRNGGQSGQHVDLQPLTSDLREEDRGRATAPAAGASVAPRVTSHDVGELLGKSLPADWLEAPKRPIPTDIDLGNVIAQLLAADWTVDNFTAALSTLGKPSRVGNPTAVIRAHLTKCLGKPAPVMMAATLSAIADTSVSQQAGRDTKPRGRRKSTPTQPDPQAVTVAKALGWPVADVTAITNSPGGTHVTDGPIVYVELCGDGWGARTGRDAKGTFVDIGGNVGDAGEGWSAYRRPQFVPSMGVFTAEAKKHLRANGVTLPTTGVLA